MLETRLNIPVANNTAHFAEIMYSQDITDLIFPARGNEKFRSDGEEGKKNAEKLYAYFHLHLHKSQITISTYELQSN